MTKNDADKLRKFSEIIKIKVKNFELLKTSLTHKSYINEHKKERIHLEHNERLEFLGDAVLELLVSRYLYENYPSRAEGELTSFRAATVRTESLFHEALKLNIGKYIYMSKGEEQTGGRKRPYILANTFEAIIGCIYLDQNLNIVNKFLEKELFYKIPKIVKKRLYIDNKSKLQEISQEILRETPIYQVVDSEGPDHKKVFTSKVVIKNKDFGTGKGPNKQEAEQNAALKALDCWKKLIAEYFGID